MEPFVHLHVHTQYSILDGQASINALVDKAMADGMPALAITDHGNMFGIKEFFNYVSKKNSKTKGAIKDAEAAAREAESAGDTAMAAEKRAEAASLKKKIFKPIFGCEVYVANESLLTHTDKHDTGRHLILLAKNEKGYHNLIKLVSHAWTRGYYMRPRTDRSELEKYHEGLIVCSACLGGEIPKRITAGQFAEAEEAIQWYKNLFGDDFYLEMQRHKATVPRANHECYPLQVNVNKYLMEYAQKFNIKLICTNDVHFVDEENAEAHDRLICLSTGKDLDDPTRMLYTKQEWMKTKAEMNALFEDVPEALSNTLEILDKVEYLGHTENFKTASKNYRSKKRVKTAKEERKLFRDTHPAIVDEHTFQVVQEIRSHRHRPTATGKVSIFSGKVFCADCGATLQYNTANSFSANQDFFNCGNYRSNTGTCTAHYIRAVTMEKIVLAHMKRVLAYVQQFETSFVKREMEKANLKRQSSVEKAKLDIVTLKRRDEDLDVLFKRIYEDMVAGRLSPERFDKLSTQYEEEQKQVRQVIGELQSLIDDGEQEAHDLRQFLKSVRKYTDPEELTAEMLNELVDKIIVHAPDKSSGHRRQKIEIYYKAAGIIDIADDLCEAGDGRGQWRKERKTA